MQISPHIHALKMPFAVPISPERSLERQVFTYLVFGTTITLIDTGVKGSESAIFAYIKGQGRDPREIDSIVLTHSHPDHIGAATIIREATDCMVAAHAGERSWIEDTDKQCAERPVPGFHALVAGPVAVDRVLTDGGSLICGGTAEASVMHTPGHSAGSISLIFPGEGVLICGDALPLPDDMPIYEDVIASVASIKRLRRLTDIEVLLSSWEPPIRGKEAIGRRIEDGLAYLHRIDQAIAAARREGIAELMPLCQRTVQALGLPPFAANPLVARGFASHAACDVETGLFECAAPVNRA